MAENADIAEWMLNELNKKNELYQEDAVFEIERRFGRAFVYDNENGNPAISRKVLNEFKKLTREDVVWERGERCWRKRQKTDEPGRRQQE